MSGGVWQRCARMGLCLWLVCPAVLQADERAWQAWREGRAVLLMRHATAPGIGDPAGFVLDDCATQRNLSAQGQAEARRWGRVLEQQGSGPVRLFSSRWCRALETGRAMAHGPVDPLPALDSFFEDRRRAAWHNAAVRQFLDSLPPGPPVVLISHQVNITALTGVFPRSGEGLLLALPLTVPARVLARLPPP